MARIDLALFEWPEAAELGGPRLLGRLADPDLIAVACDRLAAARRRDLARLGVHVRPVPDREDADE